MLNNIVCDICGGTAHLIHIGTRDRDDVNVFECEKCKTKQLDIKTDPDYEHGFMNGSSNMTEEEICSRLEQTREDDYRRAKYLSNYVSGEKILDFGCGFGGFLKYICEFEDCRPSHVAGVELSHDEREYLSKLGFECKPTIEEMDRDYDWITLFHVFEHLSSPLDWLNKIGEHIKNSGKILVEIPNGNDALLSRYQCKAFEDFTYWSAHLYLYTVQSFTDLVKKSEKLEVKEVGQIQRYPLANHLYWLSKGKPGGQMIWDDLCVDTINKAYKSELERNFECDTLLFTLGVRN